MEIREYRENYKNQIIALILYIQNFDTNVSLSLEDQPDLNDIENCYLKNGGGFWVAVDDGGDVIGTLGLVRKDKYGVLKKFFVASAYRGREKGISAKLFERLLEHARKCGLEQIVLDSPAACHRAHGFYRKMGFGRVVREELPVQYDYADRDSYFFLKRLD